MNEANHKTDRYEKAFDTLANMELDVCQRDRINKIVNYCSLLRICVPKIEMMAKMNYKELGAVENGYHQKVR